MRKLKLAAVAAALAIAAVLTAASLAGATAPGTADTLPSGAQGLATGSFSDTLTDPSGRVLSTQSGFQPEGAAVAGPWGGADRTNAGTPTFRDLPTGPSGTSDSLPLYNNTINPQAAAPGCLTHNVVDQQNDITGLFVLFQYIVQSHWCWANGAIGTMHTAVSWAKVDSTFKVDANCVGQDSQSCYGWFYQWNGNNRGGHYSSRQGDIEQDVCIPFTQDCWAVGHCYPRVQTWVNAGPYYTAIKQTNCG